METDAFNYPDDLGISRFARMPHLATPDTQAIDRTGGGSAYALDRGLV